MQLEQTNNGNDNGDANEALACHYEASQNVLRTRI